MKRWLTLDNLYDFYVNQNKSVRFNAQEAGGCLVVQIPAKIEMFEKDERSSLVPVHLKACHTGRNRNGSNIKESVMKSKLTTFHNKPILAFIRKVNGEEEFGGHEMHEENDELIYDEIPVGTIPESCNCHLEYDEEKDKTYVHVDGYLYGQYNHAPQILERKGGESKTSVELNVFELSYDAKDKVLNLDDFECAGITILGVDDDGNEIGEGMEGANITLADFSAENNSTINEKLLKEIEKLNATLSTFNIDSSLEEGGKTEMKFEEILAKFGKTFDDIDFEYENMSEEEFEAKLNELFAEAEETPSEEEDNNVDTDTEENFEEESNEESVENNFEDENSSEPEETSDFSQITSYSITHEDGSVNTFALSLNDTILALTTLVNDTYSESDNTYYSVVVYDSYLVMADYWNDRYFKQSYKKRKDVYSLTGDRVNVYPTFCTQEELDNLDSMRSNYSSIQSELQKYKDADNEAQIKDVFASDDYASIKDNKDYIAFSREVAKDYSKYTVKEVIEKCDGILTEFTKAQNRETFSEKNIEEKKSRGMVPMFESRVKSNKKSRYGNLFNKNK